ncbi:MAG TPA: RNase adapter RapZ, partial [Acidimicrobiales bacterium]|nr:RNase adapter RapZ [Acidimicrobiales bacterium]
GWYVIDNMPASLLTHVAEALDGAGEHAERVALVIGRGGGSHPEEALPAIEQLRQGGHRVAILFLDAPADVLVRRFEGTRRRHPLPAAKVHEAIADERLLLEPLREAADVVVDTGELNVHQLRARVLELLGGGDATMRTSVVSFGYKHGLPLDTDLVFDCRFLPNPHWVDELRPLSGLDEPVRAYVMGQPETLGFLDQVEKLLVPLLPAYAAEGKSYLTVAMGCTGGRHRSVVLAEELAARLSAAGTAVSVFHRDVER